MSVWISKAHKKSHVDLPMYIVYVKERPAHYTSSGYSVVNHPVLKNKYFTSKKLSDEEKLTKAYEYLHSMNAVQRLNGDGSSTEM